MSKTPVKISERAREIAEKRAAEDGFSSVDEYLDTLISDDDLDHSLSEGWLRKRIEEGIASPDVGALTPERISAAVKKGTARAARK